LFYICNINNDKQFKKQLKMRCLVKKSEIKKVSLKELRGYEVPTWQRWKNQKNVDSLVNSLKAIGQQREVIVCELHNGRKIITDGNHLRTAMEKSNYRNCYIRLNKVDREIDAFNLFVEFNTRGRSLTTLDFIVSRASLSDRNPYKTFLYDILENPRTENEANVNAKRHNLFTIPSLVAIFLGKPAKIKSGEAQLPKNYERVKSLFKYINENYVYRSEITMMTKNWKANKLNGGSIIPVMQTILQSKYNDLGNQQILDILVDYSLWFRKQNETMPFNKDNVSKTFLEYLKLKNI